MLVILEAATAHPVPSTAQQLHSKTFASNRPLLPPQLHSQTSEQTVSGTHRCHRRFKYVGRCILKECNLENDSSLLEGRFSPK